MVGHGVPEDRSDSPGSRRGAVIASSAAFRFEPFDRILAAGVAGFHDGQSAVLNVDSLADPVVAYHEAVHERIFTSTPDGQVLSVLLQILQYAESKGKALPPAVAALANCLLENSRQAHEAVATYLAIMQFSPGLGDSAYQRLPAKYRTYYHMLSDVIDERFHEPRLRCIVAEGLMVTAFDSGYLARLAESDLSSPPDPCLEEYPDERLRRLLVALKNSDAAELRDILQISELTEKEVVEQMLANDIPVGDKLAKRMLEDIIFTACEPYLRSRFKALSSLPSMEQGTAERLAKFGSVVKPFGITIGVAEEGIAGRRRTRAFWQARSLVANPRSSPLKREDDRILAGNELFDSLTQFQVLSAEPPEHLSQWMFVGWPRPADWGLSPPWGACFSTAAVLEWLGRCRDRERAKRSFQLTRSITVAVRTLDEISQFQRRVFSQIGIIDAKGNIRGRLPALFTWYWRGNWLQLLRQLSDLGPLQGLLERLEKESDGSEDGEPVAAMMLMLLKSPKIMGTFLRAFSDQAADQILPEILPLFNTGKIKEIEAPWRPIKSEAARNAFQLIQDRWSHF
jgi:hypothetical protein